MSPDRPLRVAFMASDIIAIPALEWCHQHPAVNLLAVFAQPDRPTGRGKKLVANPVKAWAFEKGIEVFQPEKLSAEDQIWVAENDVDITIVMAYGQFLKTKMLQAPKIDTINLHGSILPAYRGACPVEASILNGDAETGVSLMRLVNKMDAGPVYDVERLPIESGIKGPDLRAAAGEICPTLLERVLPKIVAGELDPIEQNEAEASYVRRLFKTDARIDFNESASAIERRSRAFFPWPGCAVGHAGTPLKIADLSVAEGNGAPGTVVEVDGQIGIACASGIIIPGLWQRPGGKLMPGKDFFRGYTLEPNTRLESIQNPPVISSEPYVYA